jgi:hypothetical protein
MLILTSLVEKQLLKIIPEKFALIFDGWTEGSTHYVALIASYLTPEGHKESLLAIAPLLNEETLGATQHIEFMQATLELYGKNLGNVVAFIGDNCSTNKKISNDTGIPLVGCASHRFNLAVCKWLSDKPEYCSVLDTIHSLMTELRKLKNAARLRALTDLSPVVNNVTRWSSKYEMLSRYLRIENEVKKISEVQDYIPSSRQRRDLSELVEHMSKFQSITKNLQKKGLCLDIVKSVFEAVVEDYPEMNCYLTEKANIINNPAFESGIAKLVSKNIWCLTIEEKEALKNLRANCDEEEEASDDDEVKKLSTYFDRCRDRKKRRLSDEEHAYIDCSFIVATSNTVERLFSTSRYVLTDQRKRMSPIMFEAFMFLKFNRNDWNLTMVASAMKSNSVEPCNKDFDWYYL